MGLVKGWGGLGKPNFAKEGAHNIQKGEKLIAARAGSRGFSSIVMVKVGCRGGAVTRERGGGALQKDGKTDIKSKGSENRGRGQMAGTRVRGKKKRNQHHREEARSP